MQVKPIEMIYTIETKFVHIYILVTIEHISEIVDTFILITPSTYIVHAYIKTQFV